MIAGVRAGQRREGWSSTAKVLVTRLGGSTCTNPTPLDASGGEREARWDHQAQIRELYDYTAFAPAQWFILARWLYTRAWLASERPIVMFDLATTGWWRAGSCCPG